MRVPTAGIAMSLLYVLMLDGAYAGDIIWQSLGVNDDGKYILHIDRESIKKNSDSEALINVKRELSEEGKKAFKKGFKKAKREAETEAGTSLQGDPEELLQLLVRDETHVAFYTFDCKGDEYKIQDSRFRSLRIVRVYPLQKESTEEKIRNIICHPEVR